LALELGDAGLRVLQRVLLHQDGLRHEIGGGGLLGDQAPDEILSLAVLRRRIGLAQPREQPGDEIAFFRGHVTDSLEARRNGRDACPPPVDRGGAARSPALVLKRLGDLGGGPALNFSAPPPLRSRRPSL
jgi:hypothetical protein